jgi:hypothetical protein
MISSTTPVGVVMRDLAGARIRVAAAAVGQHQGTDISRGQLTGPSMACKGSGVRILGSTRHNAPPAHPQRRCQQSANMTRPGRVQRRKGGGRMSETLGTTLVFIFVFIVVPWGLILSLRLVGPPP